MTKLAALGVLLGLVAPPLAATAEDVPDALAVEWQGKKLCENPSCAARSPQAQSM